MERQEHVQTQRFRVPCPRCPSFPVSGQAMQQSMLLISVLWFVASTYVDVALGVEGVGRRTASVSTSQHPKASEYHVATNGHDDNK